MAAKLTDAQIESIKSYGSHIKSLKDFVTAVQKKPGMYIGYLENKGFLNMIREIFQNAIDEVFRKDSPANFVRILYNEVTHYVEIEDNGRGIPYNNIIRIFTKEHTSSNYDKKKGDGFTSGVHGVGGKVTNALSDEFIVRSYILGEGREVRFVGGYPESDKEKVIENKDNKQGTIISFTPNTKIMGTITLTCDEVLQLVRLLLPLTPVGTKIQFQAVLASGKTEDVMLDNVDGITSFIIDNCIDPLIVPIEFNADNGIMRAHIMLTYSVSFAESVTSFSNFCPVDTVNSTHVKGFFAGLKKFLIPYMNKIYLASSNGKRKKNLTIIESDIKTGLNAVLDVAHIEPIFTGQAKDILSNSDMLPFVRDLTYGAMEQWSKDRPQDLQKLCKYIKEVATIRTSADEKKVKLSSNFNSAVNGLPSKFVRPTSSNWEDLYIVEGDSAGGSIKNHRKTTTQGVFPIRGKILNCFEKKTLADCLQNAEVAGITAIIGGGYGKSFDISKVRWKKIISAADADSAGNHINALLLLMVLRMYPELILHGRFYRALPPLFMTVIGTGKKAKKIYFNDKAALVQYVQKLFSKANEVTTIGGKKLTGRDVEELLYNNYDYIYELQKVANHYHILPEILEIYLNNRDLPEKKICSIIKKQYRFMEQSTMNGKIICDGIANGVSNTLFMGDRLLDECKDIIAIMENNMYNEYMVNGKRSTILDIMRLYDASSPSNLNRLKGLGEQDAEELAETVVYPGDMGNRTLVRYTMDSAMKEIEDIRFYHNNKNKLLDNLVITRRDIAD